MKLNVFAIAAALVVLIASPAEAKYTVEQLRIDGPGMEEPFVIKRSMRLNVMSSATLWSAKVIPSCCGHGDRGRIEKPSDLGPAYELEYRFGVGDNNGSSTQYARQLFYPFAAVGPVVFTPRGQKIELSFGDERFAGGWFKLDERMLPELEKLGLPATPPVLEEEQGVDTTPSTTSPLSLWPLALVAAFLVGGGAVLARRRFA
jgi:hypothetical protein